MTRSPCLNTLGLFPALLPRSATWVPSHQQVALCDSIFSPETPKSRAGTQEASLNPAQGFKKPLPSSCYYHLFLCRPPLVVGGTRSQLPSVGQSARSGLGTLRRGGQGSSGMELKENWRAGPQPQLDP